jgi:hypothetical protein
MAYLPCAAHNLQLVIKDGLKLDEAYTKLVKHVAEDIVNKSKYSTVIAEDLREFDLKFAKRNATRWNSILMMIK